MIKLLLFSALTLGTIWVLFLPSVPQSIYFHRPELENVGTKEKWKSAFRLLYKHFISSYAMGHVVKWSIWWAMATCGFILVQTYMQPLWDQINPDWGSGKYNGEF